jgi:hypothetical protein
MDLDQILRAMREKQPSAVRTIVTTFSILVLTSGDKFHTKPSLSVTTIANAQFRNPHHFLLFIFNQKGKPPNYFPPFGHSLYAAAFFHYYCCWIALCLCN